MAVVQGASCWSSSRRILRLKKLILQAFAVATALRAWYCDAQKFVRLGDVTGHYEPLADH